MRYQCTATALTTTRALCWRRLKWRFHRPALAFKILCFLNARDVWRSAPGPNATQPLHHKLPAPAEAEAEIRARAGLELRDEQRAPG
eukprot:scaffold109260_cov60-Phaeocystis_antarctica.AAC.4